LVLKTEALSRLGQQPKKITGHVFTGGFTFTILVSHLSGGHVGAVVSKGAKKALWPKLAAFWQARDAAPAVKAEAIVEEEAVVEAESVAVKAELVKAAVPAKAKAARPKPAKPKARRKGR
jgi:polyhydroxyalkanoate synthase